MFTIDELKKINFIYGGNGSGKTTISRYLNDSNDDKFRECSIEWDSEVHEKIFVYNKDFRDRNLKSDIPGIFTLGQATAEQLAAVNQKRTELNDAKKVWTNFNGSLIKANEDKAKAENQLKEMLWTDIYKVHQDFKECFTGAKQKETFQTKLLSVYDKSSHNSTATSIELKKKYNTLFAVETPQIKAEVPYISVPVEIDALIVNEIWGLRVVGAADIPIAAMIDRLGLTDWVMRGREVIEPDSDICPFCQQHTITVDFKKQLENFFDEKFINNINEIKDQRANFDILTSSLITAVKNILETERVVPTGYLNVIAMEGELSALCDVIALDKKIIEEKEKEPSKVIELKSFKSNIDNINALIASANAKISAHNSLVSNLETEQDNLVTAIWEYLATQADGIITKCKKEIKGKCAAVANLTKKTEHAKKAIESLEAEISALQGSITSVQPTVDAINKTLKSFGFNNFSIVPSETVNHYQIKREDGTLANNTLSEGEVTFITFLYYMQWVNGSFNKDDVSSDRILVIDDPMSSLDSNVLFVVSSLIKEILKNVRKSVNPTPVKQVILLTHNVYFHKEVTFIDGSREEKDNTHFWIIRKLSNVSYIDPYKMRNPISSSYELLWRELRESKDRLDCMSVQNIMRRIIETYFKVFGGYEYDNDILNKIQDPTDKEICRVLFVWDNEGSHDIPDDYFVENQHMSIDKYYAVFKMIFDVLHHGAHYDMMMNRGK